MCESKKAVLTLGLGQHAAILICRKTFTYRAHCLKTKATAARDSTVGTVQGRMQRALSPRYLLQLVLPLVLRDTGSSSSRLPSSTGGRSPLTSSHTHKCYTWTFVPAHRHPRPTFARSFCGDQGCSPARRSDLDTQAQSCQVLGRLGAQKQVGKGGSDTLLGQSCPV